MDGDEYYPILNISSYARKVRPWSNLVSISLFHHFLLRNIRGFPDIYLDYYVHPIKTKYSTFPSTIAPIKIFIIHHSEVSSIDCLATFSSFVSFRSTREMYEKLLSYQPYQHKPGNFQKDADKI